MKSRDFCFWLQGFFELTDETEVDKNQIDIIKRHLSLVFKHEIDPSAGDAEHQVILNTTHAVRPDGAAPRC